MLDAIRNRDGVFEQIYAIDPVTNRYMIEVALDQYTDIFDEWDPAPFKRRSLDPDLDLYLNSSSEEIPWRYGIELYFTLPKGARNEAMENEVRDGLKNSFIFKMYLLRKKLRKTNGQIFRCLLLGFLFLWIGTVFPNQAWLETMFPNAGAALAISLLAEGLFIGGWVFLWEAVSLFFFTDRDLLYQYRTYKRLLNAPVFFREAE